MTNSEEKMRTIAALLIPLTILCGSARHHHYYRPPRPVCTTWHAGPVHTGTPHPACPPKGPGSAR
jgi:hypothetical protein